MNIKEINRVIEKINSTPNVDLEFRLVDEMISVRKRKEFFTYACEDTMGEFIPITEKEIADMFSNYENINNIKMEIMSTLCPKRDAEMEKKET